MLSRVYLDNSATTPVDPKVLEAMLPYLAEQYGNASSIHFFGQQAKAAVDRARHQVARLINARPSEIIFTSGGTEANNLAIRGLAQASEHHGRHIITSVIEHPAVRNVCENLEKLGWSVTYLPVYENGIVRVADVEAALTDETVLISVMAANNEIGTLQPIRAIGRLVRDLRSSGRKIWLHTDAVQAAGKIPLDVEDLGCDLLAISGHKMYGPKGIGALYARRGVRLQPQNIGGRQERERRGGTEPVFQIVALGAAAELAAQNLESDASRLRELRDSLETRLVESIEAVTFNGDRDSRLPNILNVSFAGVDGEGLLINLDMQGIAVSTGSACSSGSLEPSPVIRALGSDGGDHRARSALRFSFGRFNTPEDVDSVLAALPKAVRTLRQLSLGTTEQAGNKNSLSVT